MVKPMAFQRNVLTVNEAAALLGVVRQRVHVFIKDGRLKADKVRAGHGANLGSQRGFLFLISRTSVLRLKAKREREDKP